MTRVSSRLWVFLIAGLALRILAIELRPAEALQQAPDEKEYHALSVSLARGLGFSLAGQPTAYRDVLFPAAASAVMRISGETDRPVLYLQALLSCATALMLFFMGKRRFGERPALAMSAAWLLYPGAILLSATFLTETLFVFLWVAALVLYDRLEERNLALWPAVSLGAVLGLVILTRALGVILLIAVVLYLALIRFEWRRGLRWRAALVVASVACVVVLPWMIRNARAVGAFTLNTNGGINLLIGNNPLATGAYRFDSEVERMLPPASAGEVERNRRGGQIARQFWREHPREAVDLCGRKFAYLWATDMSLWAHYAPRPEIPSLSAFLRSLPLWKLVLVALPYALIVCAGIAGFYLVRHFPTRGLFILQIVLGVLAACATYGLTRYHFPYMPALILAGGALWRGHVWTAAPPWRRMFLLFTLGMFGGIWLREIMTIAGV